MNTTKLSQYEAVFMPQAEGGYTVEVPDLPGCVSEGETMEQARANIAEAIESYLDTLKARGKPTPEPSESRYFVLSVPVRATKIKRSRVYA